MTVRLRMKLPPNYCETTWQSSEPSSSGFTQFYYDGDRDTGGKHEQRSKCKTDPSPAMISSRIRTCAASCWKCPTETAAQKARSPKMRGIRATPQRSHSHTRSTVDGGCAKLKERSYRIGLLTPQCQQHGDCLLFLLTAVGMLSTSCHILFP
jgi:hypothetical protein